MEPLDYSIFPEQTVTPATFGQRLGASLLDGLIVGVAGLIVGAVFGSSASFWGGYNPITTVVNGVIGWLYFALQEAGNSQATIGKKALRIKVTNMNGGKLTFGQATGRHFAKWISTILLLFGYFMMLWDDKSQTLHDKLAGALVVRA